MADLAKVQSLVTDLLKEMDGDKPVDPVAYLTERLEAPSFAEKTSRAVSRKCCGAACPAELNVKTLSIVVFGASGDLAKKKTFPALFTLFRRGLLPKGTRIVGYARSAMDRATFTAQITHYFPKGTDQVEIDDFLAVTSYVSGQYTGSEGFSALQQHVGAGEKAHGGNRVYYLALPPTVFVDVCRGIKQHAMPTDGWARVIVEKPFGRDTESSKKLSDAIGALFTEEQVFRIDHYLGKEMVQNLVALRFANHVFSALWNRHHVANVQITFKEQIGTQGRGGYFDQFGIIRDIIQNHLTQILALVAMEKPKSLDAEAVRDEKVAVLKHIAPVRPEDCVLGQYTAPADGSEPGYLEDPTVPKGSKCPTFASMVLRVKTDRWDGVPFIIKAGKALESKQVVVRIQFRDELLPFGDATQRNELVIRAQPQEAMYLKISTKTPGMSQTVHQTELDLTYRHRYDGVRLPDAYESLINEVVVGNTTNFVRSDELDAAWRIFTPLLHSIEAGAVQPVPYRMGSRGPAEADELAKRHGFVRSEGYNWATNPQSKY